MSRYPNDCKVYVGDLGNSARKNELEDSFSYYGPLRNVWIARNPPGFAFVEFEDPRDAEDAVRGLDGRTICGRRARVELSNGKSGRGYRGNTDSINCWRILTKSIYSKCFRATITQPWASIPSRWPVLWVRRPWPLCQRLSTTRT